MSEFTCPNCANILDVNDMELWEVYDEEGKETVINCPECDAEIIITSVITGWRFEVELTEEQTNE